MAIDDVLENLEILEAILEDSYNVIKVTGGIEALDLLDKDTDPDLILLDLSMPEMDGFEFLEKMRENEEYIGIPVIFVTGYNDSYSEERGLGLGAVDSLKKPYEANIIRVKTRNHIEFKTYRDNLSEAVAQRTKQLEEKTQELYDAHGAIIMGMSLLSESHDTDTGSHLLRIKSLTKIIADNISDNYPAILNKEMVDLITTYSPLHDIGKVAVTDAVLKKKGTLTAEEFGLMKEHAKGGGDLLRKLAEMMPNERTHLSVAIEIAESHHERFDGTGYPNRLVGEEIPISARIVTVADVYDALRSPRAYKPGFTHEEAMDIILKGDGRTEPAHFDPLVLHAFKETSELLRNTYDSNPDPHNFDQD
jgi:putative two-component system response regulator